MDLLIYNKLQNINNNNNNNNNNDNDNTEPHERKA